MIRTIQEIIQEAFDEIPNITPAEAKKEQDNGALIIDTREINELALTGKIKDSVHILFYELLRLAKPLSEI